MNNLSPEIERNIVQSEIEGGVWLKNIPVGKHLLIQTLNTLYKLEHIGEEVWVISGHERFCPTPVTTSVMGSTWGGSMLKIGFIGRGMHMEFHIPGFPTLTTSEIVEITEVL